MSIYYVCIVIKQVYPFIRHLWVLNLIILDNFDNDESSYHLDSRIFTVLLRFWLDTFYKVTHERWGMTQFSKNGQIKVKKTYLVFRIFQISLARHFWVRIPYVLELYNVLIDTKKSQFFLKSAIKTNCLTTLINKITAFKPWFLFMYLSTF